MGVRHEGIAGQPLVGLFQIGNFAIVDTLPESPLLPLNR